MVGLLSNEEPPEDPWLNLMLRKLADTNPPKQ